MFPKDGKYVCSSCECAVEFGKAQITVTETSGKEAPVVGEDVTTLPKTRITCEECGHTEAYFVIRQTRAADEPETRIYRCCKCNHSWREY